MTSEFKNVKLSSFNKIDSHKFRAITPGENISVAIFALGEGWHNYHHVRIKILHEILINKNFKIFFL